MTMQDTGEAPYGFDFPIEDPWIRRIDLNRFERLPETERMRVIIRVLCGLVALEAEEREQCEALGMAPPRSGPEPTPTPRSGFRLPFLGLEAGGASKWRHLAGLRSQAVTP